MLVSQVRLGQAPSNASNSLLQPPVLLRLCCFGIAQISYGRTVRRSSRREGWQVLHAAPERVAEAASGQQGGTAQGTAALAQVPPGWRDCPSILPPFGQKLTTLRQLEEGLWVLRQDFLAAAPAFNAYSNCFVLQLQDGNLMVISPISMTQEAQHLMASIPGKVTHIVCPNSNPEHWVYTPQLAQRWPDATIWACPGIAENSGLARWLPGGSDVWGAMLRSQTRSDGSPLDVRTISEGLTPTEPELASLGVMFTLYEPGANVMGQPIFKEATMLMEARSAILTSDMAFANMDEEVLATYPFFLKPLVMDVVKVGRRLGCPIPYPFMMSEPEAGRAWRDRVLAWQGWDRVLSCHLEPLVGRGGPPSPAGSARDQFKACFSFLGA